jgi:hypothetical protein
MIQTESLAVALMMASADVFCDSWYRSRFVREVMVESGKEMVCSARHWPRTVQDTRVFGRRDPRDCESICGGHLPRPFGRKWNSQCDIISTRMNSLVLKKQYICVLPFSLNSYIFRSMGIQNCVCAEEVRDWY